MISRSPGDGRRSSRIRRTQRQVVTAGTNDVGLLSQLSVAVAVPGSRVAEQTPGSVPVLMSAGHEITGAVLSITVTVCVSSVKLPTRSVAR